MIVQSPGSAVPFVCQIGIGVHAATGENNKCAQHCTLLALQCLTVSVVNRRCTREGGGEGGDTQLRDRTGNFTWQTRKAKQLCS